MSLSFIYSSSVYCKEKIVRELLMFSKSRFCLNLSVFAFMDGTAIKRTEEGRIRALDFRRQREELLDEDGDGEGDCNTHIYLQHLHDARVVDTEVHQYRGELKPEHVKFSKTGQAIVHRPHRVDDDFVHPWDNEHTVVMHHVER